MTLVVDASIVLAWCFADESSAIAEAAVGRVLEEGAIAPAHWPIEVANGLRSAERRRRIDPAELPGLQARLTTLTVDILPADLPAALSVIAIARDHELSVYDAAYLELAHARHLPLATVDGRLIAACRGIGVELVA